MKRILYIIPSLFILSLFFSSCLGDDNNETTTTPVCMIASFSVGDIVSPYTTKTLEGKDTTYNRTISGSTILFNIDQVKGEIYNVDSLPNWVNISRLVPTVTYSGILLCRQGGESGTYALFSNGKDSVDFSKDVDFIVYASDGKTSKHYKAKINQSKLNADSLYWTETNSNLAVDGAHRTLSKGDNIYVFADNGGATTVTYTFGTKEELNWTSAQPLTETIDYKSILVKGERFYGLDSSGYVYESEDGVDWTKTGDTALDCLFAADRNMLYGFDGTSMVVSSDGAEWTSESVSNIDMLPEMPVSFACYNTKTNSELQNVVMMGLNPACKYAVTWFKISSASTDSNQSWNYINITDDNPYAMPKLENIQMVRYNGMLIAFGGKSADGQKKAYECIYVSEDNGVTWHVSVDKMGMMSEWKGATKPLTMAVCGKYIWVIQSGGKVWRGEISNI